MNVEKSIQKQAFGPLAPVKKGAQNPAAEPSLAASLPQGMGAQLSALKPKAQGQGTQAQGQTRAAAPAKRAAKSAKKGQKSRVQSKYDNTQISEILFDGQNIVEGEGLYIIGSETGEDRPDQNVRSPDSNGNTLFAPGDWPGAPFKLEVTGNNPYRIRVSIGPMPTRYNTLSLPLDLKKNLFDSFSFSGNGYEVGAGGTWQKRPGNGGRYKDVPQPAHIEGHGNVGVAKTKINGPGFWAEVSGALAKVRRTIVGGDAKEMHFYHHPYTHNIEINFGTVKKGAMVHHEEILEIMASNETGAKPEAPGSGGGNKPPATTPGGGPPAGGANPAAARKRLEPLYLGLLGRKIDEAGAGTFSPEAAQGLSGLEKVARQVVASGEFSALRGRLNDRQLLEQMYKGFFGRKLDASGAATFSPWLASGRTLELVEALMRSPEFRTRHGV
jgi:hypothetical protein